MLIISLARLVFFGRQPAIVNLHAALRPTNSGWLPAAHLAAPTDLHVRYAAFCLYRISSQFLCLVALPTSRTSSMVCDAILHIVLATMFLMFNQHEMDKIEPLDYTYFVATSAVAPMLVYCLVVRFVPNMFEKPDRPPPEDRWPMLLVIFYLSVCLTVLGFLRFCWYYVPHYRQLQRTTFELSVMMLHLFGLFNALVGMQKVVLEICLRYYIQDASNWSLFRLAMIEERFEVNDQQLVVVAHPDVPDAAAQPQRRAIGAMHLTDEELTECHFEYMYWLSEMWTDAEFEEMEQEMADRS